MRRWTDGRRWGASRVGGGGFLVYTEYVFTRLRRGFVQLMTSSKIIRFSLTPFLSRRLATQRVSFTRLSRT